MVSYRRAGFTRVLGIAFMLPAFGIIPTLVDFHNGMERYFASPQDAKVVRARFQKALGEARQAQERAAEAFPEPIDPSGGEVGIIRTQTVRLVDAIKVMLGQIS